MSVQIDRRDILAIAGAGLATATVTRGSVLAADRRGSSKKGFCIAVDNEGAWPRRLVAVNPKWFYTWGDSIPDGVPEGVEFVPMIWGYWGQEESFARLKRQAAEGKIRHLLGFNEPDQHDQSNIGVARALELWPKLMEIGLPLGSPGCVHPDREWMKAFMPEVEKRKLRVDFVCVHTYGGPDVEALYKRLKNVYETFGRPLWLTEFAVGDWEAKRVQENRHSPRRIAAFMREALPMLEAAKFVHRYTWFSGQPDWPALGTSVLFDKQGKLTELGEIYRTF